MQPRSNTTTPRHMVATQVWLCQAPSILIPSVMWPNTQLAHQSAPCWRNRIASESEHESQCAIWVCLKIGYPQNCRFAFCVPFKTCPSFRVGSKKTSLRFHWVPLQSDRIALSCGLSPDLVRGLVVRGDGAANLPSLRTGNGLTDSPTQRSKSKGRTNLLGASSLSGGSPLQELRKEEQKHETWDPSV